jgi:hypothetical protein
VPVPVPLALNAPAGELASVSGDFNDDLAAFLPHASTRSLERHVGCARMLGDSERCELGENLKGHKKENKRANDANTQMQQRETERDAEAAKRKRERKGEREREKRDKRERKKKREREVERERCSKKEKRRRVRYIEKERER